MGIVGAALLVLAPLSPAHANGWARLPNGEWGFTQQITTAGMFTCLSSQFYLVGGSCIAAGNILTLVSGSSSMTVRFTGSIQDVLATNVRSESLVMGTFTKTFTGGPFSIPPMASQNAQLFSFRLTLTGSSAGSGSVVSGYTARDRTSLPYNCCDSYSTYAAIGFTAQPPGLNYSTALYDNFAGRDITFDSSPHTITARVGLIPEPATNALIAVGLLALFAFGRARERLSTKSAPASSL